MTNNPNHSKLDNNAIPHSPIKGMVTEKVEEDATTSQNRTSMNTTDNSYKNVQNKNNIK